MFKLLDGRKEMFQWDLDRKLIVEDANINEVHFCNRTDECSLVVETYVEDGLTLANVPNILLQTDWKINVYAYDEKYTKHSAVFKVVGRTKPADYIYTETELKEYNAFADDVEQLQKDTEALEKADTKLAVEIEKRSDAIIGSTALRDGGAYFSDLSTLPQTIKINKIGISERGLSIAPKNMLPYPYSISDTSYYGVHCYVYYDGTMYFEPTADTVSPMATFGLIGYRSSDAKPIPSWMPRNQTLTFYYGKTWGYANGVKIRIWFYDDNMGFVDSVLHTITTDSDRFTFTIPKYGVSRWYISFAFSEGMTFSHFYIEPKILYGIQEECITHSRYEEPRKLPLIDGYYTYKTTGNEDNILLVGDMWDYLGGIKYYKSLPKTIQKLTDAIISLGGNV